MSNTEQREIAGALFPNQPREEIKGAIELEEERRAVLVKNLYRLKALRLSRDRGSTHKRVHRRFGAQCSVVSTRQSIEIR
jgi:hypothetical protein